MVCCILFLSNIHFIKKGAHRYAQISGETHRALDTDPVYYLCARFLPLRLMPVEGYFANYRKNDRGPDTGQLTVHGPAGPAASADPPLLESIRSQRPRREPHPYKVNASVPGITRQKLPISIRWACTSCCWAFVIRHPDEPVHGPFKTAGPIRSARPSSSSSQAVPAAVYYLYIQMYGTTALNVGPIPCSSTPPGNTGCCPSAP